VNNDKIELIVFIG